MSINVKLDVSGIKDLEAKLKSAGKVRVGILGANKNRKDGGSSLSNAEIGRIHEFGSVTRKIPARSFLRMPLRKNVDELLGVFSNSSSVGQALSEGNSSLALELLGVKAEGIVLGAFRSNGYGQWAKLKSKTLEAKGSNKALIATGQLRRSITSKVIANGT